MRASTAAHNSARFTYVSPAGDLGNSNGSVIDGGYFENYGALSALEIARSARVALKDEQPGVKLVILMISSDPSLESSHTLVRIKRSGTAEMPGERRGAGGRTGSPAFEKLRGRRTTSRSTPRRSRTPCSTSSSRRSRGWQNVREAHGNRAAAELAVEVCSEFPDAQRLAAGSVRELSPQDAGRRHLDDFKNASVADAEPVEVKPDSPYFAHLAMCEGGAPGAPAPVQPPLGWMLSKATQDHFRDLLTSCGNDAELGRLELALGKPPAQRAAAQ